VLLSVEANADAKDGFAATTHIANYLITLSACLQMQRQPNYGLHFDL
jgi:hypothetical protein